ncbi:glycosyltransferase family 2 protein [Bacteroides eggerthii]|jgi:glycosyltransferase involved in cell wall biosynthesis|uniref:glycosyltransferase family 2 protein n=1 Tax=Bacteroides eggerthii TaxID=28111 RepID=UPI0022E84F16|nr:glycosyltransferase family 2 protein [Bacteroides eggerthii]
MKVTIITVCFNASEDLQKTLDSVLNQEYTNLEYLIVDGGSQDNTLELLKQYEILFISAGKSFRYISEKDNGTYDAMNKGARLARGEWINYMNAGDSFYATTTLQEVFSHKITDNVGVVYGDTLQIFDFGSGIAKASDYMKDNQIMPFCHQSCFVKTKLMKEYQFDLTYQIVADHDLFFRLTKNHIKFQYIPVVIARYNGQYGLSATNPLTLRLERLQIHHITQKWYYPIALIWTYLRYGWIQTFKNNMPHWMTNAWMKHKRKFIIKNT